MVSLLKIALEFMEARVRDVFSFPVAILWELVTMANLKLQFAFYEMLSTIYFIE